MAHTFEKSNRITTSAEPATAWVVPAGVTVIAIGIVAAGATLRTGGAPTFNGKAFTQAGTTQQAAASPETSCEMWYLLAPDVGMFDIIVPNTGLITLHINWSNYISATGQSALDDAQGSNGTSANPSVNITASIAGDAIVASLGDGLATAPTAQSGTNMGRDDNGAYSSSHQYTLTGSTGLIASSWTVASDDWCMCVVAFKEVSAAVTVIPTPILLLMGVG
jgi:hypothetical protein